MKTNKFANYLKIDGKYSSSDIIQLEEYLQMKLPNKYRKCLLRYGYFRFYYNTLCVTDDNKQNQFFSLRDFYSLEKIKEVWKNLCISQDFLNLNVIPIGSAIGNEILGMGISEINSGKVYIFDDQYFEKLYVFDDIYCLFSNIKFSLFTDDWQNNDPAFI